MKTLFLVLSRGGLLRTLSESHVIEGLCERDFRVVILTPPSDEQARYASELEQYSVVFEPLLTPRPLLVRRILQELQRAVVFNDTVQAIYRYTIASKRDPSRILYWPRLYLLPILRFIPYIKPLTRALARAVDPQKEHDALFTKYRPDLVFSTTPHDESDAAVLKSALRFGTPSICMPKGWDNLPKILFPVKTDRILVWSPHMKEEAIALQDYATRDVVITGAPQFDFYAHPEHRWSREEFARRHGLDPSKRIILYGSSGADMCDEARFLDLLEEYMAERPGLQVLIRPHAGYRDDAARFARFAGRPDFRIDRTISQSLTPRSAWDMNPERLLNLYNSLTHADVCVNVGSTLTIDATLCDTPVINLNFDVDPGVDPMRRSVKRLFETSYIKDIMNCGATWLVTSKGEFFAALDETLSDRDARREQRRRLIERFAYANDGGAAVRIVDAVTSI